MYQHEWFATHTLCEYNINKVCVCYVNESVGEEGRESCLSHKYRQTNLIAWYITFSIILTTMTTATNTTKCKLNAVFADDRSFVKYFLEFELHRLYSLQIRRPSQFFHNCSTFSSSLSALVTTFLSIRWCFAFDLAFGPVELCIGTLSDPILHDLEPRFSCHLWIQTFPLNLSQSSVNIAMFYSRTIFSPALHVPASFFRKWWCWRRRRFIFYFPSIRGNVHGILIYISLFL